MEVVIPVQTMDFDFNSARASTFLSAPSSPKRFGELYYSAPTSPTYVSQFYRDFDDFSMIDDVNMIENEENKTNYEDEFAFDLGNEAEKVSLSAEELFDGGKIRPFKPTPEVLQEKRVNESEIRNSPTGSSKSPLSQNTHKRSERERGRERNYSFSSLSSSRRGTRSLSPYRVSAYPWEEEEKQSQSQHNTKQTTIAKPSTPSVDSNLPLSSSKGSRKWKLKDFFLFRSASEGRAADRDPLKKHTALFWKHEDLKNTSFRSVEGSNSGSWSSKRRGAVSPHELHYKVNKAVSEDLKKKTFLPYKQGIFALTSGFGFSRK